MYKNIYWDLINQKKSLAIVGLGYVGLPLAIAFSEKLNVVGFDIDAQKINNYVNGKDITGEVGSDAIKNAKIKFTSDENDLKNVQFFIIAVPTPITSDKMPDFTYITSASEVVGRNISRNSIVVYESTVYPGVTEDICIPLLEKESGLKCGSDFKIGYSPERINPGDKENTLENIIKIVSGMDEEALEIISQVYELIIKAGVYRAENIKVAEAAKVVENTQRDINIAFMNELAMIFNRMDIDTKAVLKAASTKWNFINFTPGLVGGHCIGVDPYYFIYKAKDLGYHSPLISAGRKINDDLGRFIGNNIIKIMIHAEKKIKNSKILILGITFKENCSDARNTKVMDIIEILQDIGIQITVWDPVADKEEVLKEYNVDLKEDYANNTYDAIVIAVAHDQFKKISLSKIEEISSEKPILIDIKRLFDETDVINRGICYWSL
ncbi:UDP-N-acetyl-D-glucosamine 6-dehydrogenase [anaerobic digester metagenome]|nr:MAG: nucleotide sugar dehydrogenase [Methanobacteriales archaeon HGW-Methanobacteriales-2]